MYRLKTRLTSQPQLRVELLEDRTVPTTLPAGFEETIYASGLTVPTSMAFAPDGRLFVTEKAGALRVVTSEGTLLPTPFVQLDVNTEEERGLLGITFDPNFTDNRFVYVFYSTNDANSINRVSRFTASADNPNTVEPGSEQILLDNINPPLAASWHNGGALHFGTDGKLYIAVGESGFFPQKAQDPTNLQGKILRINSDGSIPNDNPFVGQAGARGEIWALGFRNPYTFAVNPVDGRIFVNDVGEDSFEEINDLQGGGNYGWPNAEGSDNGNPNFIDPIHAYAHNGQSAAITGGVFALTNAYPAGFQGYFYSDYLRGFIRILDPVTHQPREFATAAPSPVDLDVAPDGTLMYLSLLTGQVRRIQHTGLPPVTQPSVSAPTTTATLTPPSVPTSVALIPSRQGRTVRLTVRVQFNNGRVVQIVSPFQRNLYRAIQVALSDSSTGSVLFTARRLRDGKQISRMISV